MRQLILDPLLRRVISLYYAGRFPDLGFILLPVSSLTMFREVTFYGFRRPLQWRDRDGFPPSSLTPT